MCKHRSLQSCRHLVAEPSDFCPSINPDGICRLPVAKSVETVIGFVDLATDEEMANPKTMLCLSLRRFHVVTRNVLVLIVILCGSNLTSCP